TFACTMALSVNATRMMGMNQSSRAELVDSPPTGAGTSNRPFANPCATSGTTGPVSGGMVAFTGDDGTMASAAASHGSARRAARVITSLSLPQIPEDGWPDRHHSGPWEGPRQGLVARAGRGRGV